MSLDTVKLSGVAAMFTAFAVAWVVIVIVVDMAGAL